MKEKKKRYLFGIGKSETLEEEEEEKKPKLEERSK